ncbi:MAG: sialidase family protein [Acidimicrobiales bacterium]
MTPTNLAYTPANNSPVLAADPTDGRFVVAAHRVDAPVFGCGLQVSGDGGRGWVGVDPVPVLPEGADVCYAPEVAFDRKGTLFYLFVGLQGLGNEPMGVFLTTSSDRGRTFSSPRQVLGEQNYQVRLAIDRGIGERGRLYLVWLHSSSDPPLGGLLDEPNPILSAYSDDGGVTLSTPVQISDPTRRRAVGPSLVLARDHAVHVAHYDLQDDARDYQGLEGPAWDGTWSVVVTTSTDRGRTFTAGTVVDDMIAPPGRVMLIYTMSPPAFAAGPEGRLYAAWPDAREGDPDIYVARSAPGGARWEPPRRLNDDHTGSRVTQELPRLAVSPGGRLDAVFLDRRNDPANIKHDAYFAYSLDEGKTFSTNVRLTTEGSDSRIGQRYRNPSAQGLVELGSRIALLSRDGDAIAGWPDMRNASFGTNQQDIFATLVRVPEDGDGDGAVWLTVVAGIAALFGASVAGVLLMRRRRRST